MNPAIKRPEQLVKENDSFVLKLNKEIYTQEVLQKALEEDKDWVEEIPSADNYYSVRLKTDDEEDVWNWASYLIYINKG